MRGVGSTPRIAPVLTSFFVGFNIRTEPPSLSSNTGSTAVASLQVRTRGAISLWNPYTSALVPEQLRIEISGLPEHVAVINDSNPSTPIDVPLRAVLGSPMKLDLDWVSSGGEADTQSWLPGRQYSWVTAENKTPSSSTFPTRFYRRDIGDAGQGIWLPASTATVDGDDFCHLEVTDKTRLRIELFAVRAGGDERLGVFESPEFEAFSTASNEIYQNGYQFGFVFRLAEPIDGAPGQSWLTADQRDFREETLLDMAYVFGAQGERPELYENYSLSSFPDRLFDRVQGSTGRSYNEDVPVFELPRAPILSLGALQHLRVPGARPFGIGNPWGATLALNGDPANAIFDRFMFSGLSAPAQSPMTDEMLAALVAAPLPNPQLVVLPRKPDGTPALLRDVLRKTATIADPTDGFSSVHLLQRGAFNFNSANPRAWLAVLRGARFANGVNFAYLNASSGTGTSADSTRNADPGPADAVFYRFPQSAQETFEADEPVEIDVGGTLQLSTYAASNTTTGTDPTVPSSANTHLFRRGMRALSAAESVAFANAIATRVQAKLAASGPFRTAEEFLNPQPLFMDGTGRNRSLLEAAIEDVNLNGTVGEFSSQWLTQADVMTALAPFLFPRSDTFVIRTYGDVLNPATSTATAPVVEGRAWCEAIVQRVPDYFNPAADDATIAPAALADPSGLNQLYGRRFKVVSFRWLTRSDI